MNLTENRATRWWTKLTAQAWPGSDRGAVRIGRGGWVASSIAFAAFLSLLPLLGLVALGISAILTLFSGLRLGRSLMRGIGIASGIEQDRGPLATQAMAAAVVAHFVPHGAPSR